MALPYTDSTDPSAGLVEELLSMLETGSAPEPPKAKTWQKIVGSLGDAITARASVLAGGGPPGVGAFQSQLARRQQLYEEQKASVEAEGRKLRNTIRVRDFERQLSLNKDDKNKTLKERQAALGEVKRRGYVLVPNEEKEYLLTGRLPNEDNETSILDMLRLAQLGGNYGVVVPEEFDPHGISKMSKEAILSELKKDKPEIPSGFSSFDKLENAVRQTADDIFRASESPTEIEVKKPDPYRPGETQVTTEVRMIPSMTYEEALKQAIGYFGAESFYPHVGFDEEKKDVPTESGPTMKEIREELNKRGS